MKSLYSFVFLLVLSTLVRAQSYEGSTSMSYETPFSKNGLRFSQVIFHWEVMKPGLFGDIVVGYDITTIPNYTEYIYNGKPYISHGEEESLFRKVVAKTFIIRAKVEGPGFSKVMLLGGSVGWGKGAISGNSKHLIDAKTKEGKNVKNWSVTPLEVVEIGWDGGWPLQQLIERREAEFKKQEAFDKSISEGDAAAGRKDWSEAIRAYQKAKNINSSNPKTQEKIARAQDELKKKGVKDNYDGLVKAAQDAEQRGDKKTARNLYDQAVATGHNDPAASYGSDRVTRQIEDEEKRKADELAKKEAEAAKKAREHTEKQEEDARKIKAKMDALREAEDKANQARHDSLKTAMAAEEQRKWDAAREKEYNDRKAQEEADEKRRETELKTESEERRKEDEAEIASFEKHMSYNPELYDEALTEADSAYDYALSIDPTEALQLKKEWWDNNPYIQVIADDLYEPQRQASHEEYMRGLYAELRALNNAKGMYMAALSYVDNGSPQHKFLLRQIEKCNRDLDWNRTMLKYSPSMETNRKKYREQTKMMVAAQMRAANHERAEAAFMIYEMNIADGENQAKYMMDKLAFEEKLNKADAQYKQDAVVTGVTHAVATNMILDDNTEAQAVSHNSFVINAYAGGLISAESTPILMNHTSDGGVPETRTDELMTIPVLGGLDIWFLRSNHLDIGANGNFVFGVFPSKGTSSLALSYGGRARIDIGFKHFKLANTIEYLERYGEQTIDYDVVLSANNPFYQYQNHVAEGMYDYSVFRIGTGFKLDISNEYNENFIMFQMFAEKPSFYPGSITDRPIYSSMAMGQFGQGINVTLRYAHNYVIAGEKLYTVTERDNKAYWSITLGKSWTLFNSANL